MKKTFPISKNLIETSLTVNLSRKYLILWGIFTMLKKMIIKEFSAIQGMYLLTCLKKSTQESNWKSLSNIKRFAKN